MGRPSELEYARAQGSLKRLYGRKSLELPGRCLKVGGDAVQLGPADGRNGVLEQRPQGRVAPRAELSLRVAQRVEHVEPDAAPYAAGQLPRFVAAAEHDEITWLHTGADESRHECADEWERDLAVNDDVRWER